MRAVVHHALEKGAVELRDVPQPKPGENQVLVRVRAVAVCGSDLHQRANRQSWPVHVPVVLGHEFSGEIAEVGKNCDGFEIGERVTCETAAVICGRCTFCRTGNYQQCRRRKGFGYGIDGAMAEYVAVPTRIVHRLPPNVGFEQAALTEPCCVAYNAVVERGALRLGDVTVILGPGAIGTLCMKMAALSGSACVILAGLRNDQHRLDLGLRFGATHVVALDEEDLEKLVNEQTRGDGADVVVDATGVSAALRSALDVVRPLGRIVKVGWGPEPFAQSLDLAVQKAVDIRGSFSHNYPMWERVLRAMSSGMLDVSPLIGGTYPIEQWKEAFEAMERGDNLKSVIVFKDQVQRL